MRIMLERGKRRAAARAAAVAAIVACLILPAPLSAAEPDWPQGPYKYLVIDQTLRDVLLEFGRRINVPVRVSDAVGERRLRGMMPAASAREFLQSLCERYGLVWYYDGARLHVDAALGRNAGRTAPAAGDASAAKVSVPDASTPRKKVLVFRGGF